MITSTLNSSQLVPPRMQRARGDARISAAHIDGRTRLQTLYQDGCAKIRLPHAHREAIDAVMINTAGGLTGGDQIAWGADLGAGGQLQLTTQACERIYRSTGADAQIRTSLNVGIAAHLDWLPQETILFAGSKLDRRIEIDLATDASLTAVEAVLLGRDAMGEEARDAVLRDNWRIRRNGRLIHAEASVLGGHARERDGISLLAGARAFASIIHVCADPQQRLAAVRALLPDDGTIGVSASGERLVVRAMARTGLALRRLIVPIIAELSAAGSLPRLWTL